MTTARFARGTWLAAVLTLAGALFPVATGAQPWPAKPIRMIVNFPPGGAADVFARALSPGLSEALGQQVVAENRPGANGNIGAEAVARSPGDGYTLLMSSGGAVSVNPHLYARMSFDPAKDLRPVAAVALVRVFLVTKPSLPVASVREFIAYARANPGKLSYASAGNGSSPHLAGEMFKRATKVDIVHVPYKGAGPALTDLLGGQVDFMFDPGIGLRHAREGKLRLLAVGSPRRASQYPDLPTLAEEGLDGFDADTWFGVYAPAGVSDEMVARLNREINRLLQAANVRETVSSLGGESIPLTPAQFADRQRADSARFGALIREAGIKAE